MTTLHLPLLFALPLALLRAADPASPPNVAGGVGQYEMHPAFELQLVATEPTVQDPVDLQFDEHGTAFVVEMGGYPFASEDPQEYPGKVVILEDTDADGLYDRRTLFADKFQYADSILPHRGGILVASPPDILFLKDTDGDRRADIREVWISGFSVGNAQHNVNGLIHGLDNWIYAGNGGNSGMLFWPQKPAETFPIRNRDFKFDFARQRLEFFGPTTTGFNVAIDDWGHIFTTHNLKHINHLVFPLRYVERNPFLSPRGNPDISDHKTGALDRGYSIGKQDARLNHPEQSGYFSCSCGITFYGGGAFPDAFQNTLFVADSVLNIIHRDQLVPDGPSFRAARARDKVEFLATADRNSRPVNMRVGPDGALYMVDMYRVVIEHPEWIPDELEKDMDLYAGAQQGRIYRVTPKAGLARVQPRFNRRNLPAVVRALEHPNRWWRETAQRLLVWWDDSDGVIPLRQLLAGAILPQARVHALWTLRGLSPQPDAAPELGALTEALLLRALQDPHPGVRENALIIAETGLASATQPDRAQRISAVLHLADDSDARVRMQATLTMGELPTGAGQETASAVSEALLRILTRDLAHDWSRFAVLTCLSQDPLPVFSRFLEQQSASPESQPERKTGRDAFLLESADLIGTQRNPNMVATALSATAGNLNLDDSSRLAVLTGLNTGLAKGGQLRLPDLRKEEVNRATRTLQPRASIRLLAELWGLKRHLGLELDSDQQDRLNASRDSVLDPQRSLDDRLANLRLLAFADFDFRQETLWSLLGFQHPQDLQLAALRQLLQNRDPAVITTLIDRWSSLSRACRPLASDALIHRPANHDLLLTALEEERLSMGQLNLDLERRRRLLRSSEPTVRQRAEALFTDAGVVTRAEVLTQLKPALQLIGNPDAGRVHYTNLCAQCHTIVSTGHSVGPDLTEIFRKGADTLLSDMFDPNAAVNTEYLGTTIDNDVGDVFSGIVLAETETFVTIREAGGRDIVIPRDRIEDMISGGLSLMPEGLEMGLTLQDVADLLAYLQQAK